MSVRAANSPASWGIEPPDPPQDPPFDHVLAEIARAGYPGTELGPLGYLPVDGARLTGTLARHRLTLAAGFVMTALERADQAAAIAAATRTTCSLLRAGGAGDLILIDAINPERAATAGRGADARRLDDAAWARLIGSVRRIAAIAGGEFSLRVSFHAHAGTNVEFEDEVERLLAEVPAHELGLCPDTGHYTYAGMDAAEMMRRHASRVRYVHLKDIDAERLERARTQRRTFGEAVADGVFRPLGEGCVDFAAVRSALAALGYDGWVTVEQDRLPDASQTPLDEARRSLAFLRRARLVS